MRLRLTGKGVGGAAQATIAGLAFVVIAAVQPEVARTHATTRAQAHVYALPAPEQTLLLSMGYRAALADFIYAHVRVLYGLHFEARTRFEHVGDYLDAVTTLDPLFRQPYLFADTLITVQPKAPRPEDYEKAREILLRGTRMLPYDQEVWFVAGQFVAYIAPPHLSTAEQKQQWRTEGATLLSRACELATSNVRIPQHCLTAAGLFSRAGEREAMIQLLARTLAVVDDEEVQSQALASLQRWGAEGERERLEHRRQAFAELWRGDLPHVPKDRLLLLGPPFDAAACLGRPPLDVWQGGDCVTTWRDWAAAQR